MSKSTTKRGRPQSDKPTPGSKAEAVVKEFLKRITAKGKNREGTEQNPVNVSDIARTVGTSSVNAHLALSKWAPRLLKDKFDKVVWRDRGRPQGTVKAEPKAKAAKPKASKKAAKKASKPKGGTKKASKKGGKGTKADAPPKQSKPKGKQAA